MLRLTDLIVEWCIAVGLRAKFKILLSFYQVCSVLSTTYSARLPDKYTNWTNRLFRVINVDWTRFFMPAQCLPYSLRLVAIAVGPVAVIALLLLGGVALRAKRWLAGAATSGSGSSSGGGGGGGGNSGSSSSSGGGGGNSSGSNSSSSADSSPSPPSGFAKVVLHGVLAMTPPSLLIIFCFVSPVSASIFRAWACTAYTISQPDAPLEQVSYMMEDARVECGTGQHDSITLLAGLLLGVWPFGSLVLNALLLIPCGRALRSRNSTAITRATAFLHAEYKVNWYWWEELELARKILLTGAVLLIPEERAFLRLVVATLICSCHVALVAATKPYKRIEDSVLAVATSLVLLLIFLGANWISIFLRVEERTGRDDAVAVLGFSDVYAMADAMVVLTVAVLLGFLVAAIAAARRMARKPILRLSSTKQAPELTLGTGLTWHLFNSHVWSSGQDAAAVIKTELRHLLPGIKIFLDVDDLEDLGSLEEYIQRSQVILIFMTKGYWRSKNCLREVYASLGQGKPLVLVQEIDPTKGGGTLEELRAECPPALRTAIFGAGRRVVTWHRKVEFQAVSLKMIAEGLLLHTPTYLTETSLSLVVPGETQLHDLAFTKPVVVWASPANDGARALAAELARTFVGLTITEDAPETATHMLLYLSSASFTDPRLAEQVEAARAARLPIVLAHENDPQRGGCPFSRFFKTTPQELVSGGLYDALAIAFFCGPHREAPRLIPWRHTNLPLTA